MAIQILSNEPSEVTAGDTIKWTRTLGDYPTNASWEIAYRLRGDKNYLLDWETEVTPSGSGFLVNVPSSTSTTWVPGLYTLFGFASLLVDGQRQQFYRAQLTVHPNHGNATTVIGAFDGRTHAQKALEAIEAMMLNAASREEENYVVSYGNISQSVRLWSPEQRIKLHAYYSSLRKDEIAAERVKSGKASGARILVKF